MKIEYLRNIQFGYMRIEVSEPLSKTEIEMLSRNVIEGILPIRWQKENDIYLLRYDITGKQALDMLLENSAVDETLLRSLLSGICMVVKQLEKYLLEQGGLLLSPETIFWDGKKEQMFFCYCPGEKATIQERFRQLMEYILTKTDHKNLAAIELSYGAYEESLDATFVLQDIQRRLEKKREPHYVEEAAEADEGESLRTEVVEEDCEQIWWKVWKQKMVAWINEQMRKVIKRKAPMEAFVFEPEEEEEKKGLPTVLLSERVEVTEGILRYEGNHMLPDIHIAQAPFIIGSGSNCNGIINCQTISHQHAKIHLIDGVYYIEDLNSTNGTMVDGELLSYKTKVSLKKNISVCFANEPYRFM